MKVLFLSLIDFDTFDESNIYTDLLREFIKNGHDIYCISPIERRKGIKTHFKENGRLLKLKIGNIQKTNIIEKGISTFMIEWQLVAAIKKFFKDVKFDLILYSTPPCTFVNVIKYVKKRDSAKTYLMLKDIFPQNAVDLGMMTTTGIRGLVYKYFRKKEKNLYALSDYIGCMSQANVEYLLQNNYEIPKEKVEICPNCIEVSEIYLTEYNREEIRNKYGIPKDKIVFVYGGNLGKPQGIPFIIECLRSQKDNQDVFFLIIGDGTEYYKLFNFVKNEKQSNVKLMNRLPKEEWDKLIMICDIGMIFLDHRFTIPNFPSRILSYMQSGLPVLACTDPNTDIGKVITDGDFGWWCESNHVENFIEKIQQILNIDISQQKGKSKKYLYSYYTVQNIYLKCFDHFTK